MEYDSVTNFKVTLRCLFLYFQQLSSHRTPHIRMRSTPIARSLRGAFKVSKLQLQNSPSAAFGGYSFIYSSQKPPQRSQNERLAQLLNLCSGQALRCMAFFPLTKTPFRCSFDWLRECSAVFGNVRLCPSMCDHKTTLVCKRVDKLELISLPSRPSNKLSYCLRRKEQN